MNKVRILLADDHQIVREGLRSLIEKEADMEVVGEASDGRATVELAEKLKPHVVVMDVTMPELNGVDATRHICDHHGDTRVIALSVHAERAFVRSMLRAGASGYLLKNCAADELVKAVRAAMAGETYLSSKIAGIVVEDSLEPAARTEMPAHTTLTPREREVLQLVAEGLTTQQIATRLKVSPKTVETHRAKIMDKLNIRSVAELTKYAIRNGLTSLEG